MINFVDSISKTLESAGFTPENSLACIVSCRDELCRPLTHLIEAKWGDSFDLAALGGLFSAGRTGLGAALSHVPNPHEPRLVVFVFSHVGIDKNGTVGRLTRPSHTTPTTACGALCAFHAQINSNQTEFPIDPKDVEQSYLAQKLSKAIDGKPDLMSLTRTTLDLSIREVQAILDQLSCEYAIVGGIHIHHELKEDEVSEVASIIK